MPANITVTGDKAEMMYTGKTPWHGLGQKLEQVATAEEAIEAAGLDWEVNMEPVFAATPLHRSLREEYKATKANLSDRQKVALLARMQSSFEEIPGRRAAVRSEPRKHFGIFSKLYKPLQNRDAFGFFDSVVGAGEAIYHTAGSLGGGARVWILAKLPGDLKLSNSEVLEKYILLCNSHDGSLAVTMKPTFIRVVCENTMSIALNGDTAKIFRAIHTTNVMDRVNQAREALGLQEAYFEMMMRGIERLADTRMKEAEVEPFLVKLFDQEENPDNISTKMKNNMDKVASLYYGGTATFGESRWDMMNAVTEYTDHWRGSNNEKRLDAAWFGSGKILKQQAWNMLEVPAQVTSV